MYEETSIQHNNKLYVLMVSNPDSDDQELYCSKLWEVDRKQNNLGPESNIAPTGVLRSSGRPTGESMHGEKYAGALLRESDTLKKMGCHTRHGNEKKS